MPKSRILLVHAQRTFSAALTSVLERDPDLRVVGAVPSRLAARAALDTLRPDVVVIGKQLEGEEDGIQLLEELTADASTAPNVVMIVEGPDRLGLAAAAVRGGAVVVVPSDSAAEDLVEAIHEAALGHGWIPPPLLGGVLRLLVRAPDDHLPHARLFERLTDREAEILQYLVAGFERARIATDLELSPNTVRTHVGNILRKLEVHSTLEAVTLAYASGMPTDKVPDMPWT